MTLVIASSYSKIYKLWQRKSKWGMECHLQKCSVLSVSRARFPIRHPYKLKGHTLETEESTKYVGVDLQTTLSWNNHIDTISKKANNMVGFLRRNLRSCSAETKANAYFSMAMSNLEHCPSVWSPHRKKKIRKLEMVQGRAAR